MRHRLPASQVPMLLVLLALFVAAVVPFVWMLSTAFKTNEGINAWPPVWIPRPATMEHFKHLLEQVAFGRALLNSLIVSLTVTGVSLFLNALAGYVFAKFTFPMRDTLFFLLLLTLMVPGQVTMIPVFILLRNLGLLNSYGGLILPGAVSVFGIFLMRQFMQSLPDAYMESARIDGCSEFGIFLRVALPLAGPALAALAIFTFMSAWSDFMLPLIVMQRHTMYTLPVALATLSGQHTAEWGLLMAGSVVTVMPVAVVFLILQRRFIEGMMMSGVKG
jgi:multiple sugar transport system permease protein